MTRITLLCSDTRHPVYPILTSWAKQQTICECEIRQRVADITKGSDLIFLVSCTELIPPSVLKMFRHALVLHASALPNGKGWSPHIWEVLAGANSLTLSLIEAAEKVDSGDIWKQSRIELDGTELYDEINQKLFDAEIEMIEWACLNIDTVSPIKQQGQSSDYRKRTPTDSQLDPQKTIADQFNLLRVCDPNRFPAYFKYQGTTYTLKIEKADKS